MICLRPLCRFSKLRGVNVSSPTVLQSCQDTFGTLKRHSWNADRQTMCSPTQMCHLQPPGHPLQPPSPPPCLPSGPDVPPTAAVAAGAVPAVRRRPERRRRTPARHDGPRVPVAVPRPLSAAALRGPRLRPPARPVGAVCLPGPSHRAVEEFGKVKEVIQRNGCKGHHGRS